MVLYSEIRSQTIHLAWLCPTLHLEDTNLYQLRFKLPLAIETITLPAWPRASQSHVEGQLCLGGSFKPYHIALSLTITLQGMSYLLSTWREWARGHDLLMTTPTEKWLSWTRTVLGEFSTRLWFLTHWAHLRMNEVQSNHCQVWWKA
jgi:hypothetical protein